MTDPEQDRFTNPWETLPPAYVRTFCNILYRVYGIRAQVFNDTELIRLEWGNFECLYTYTLIKDADWNSLFDSIRCALISRGWMSPYLKSIAK